MNKVIISGTLTKDPELKQGANYKLVNLLIENKRKVREGRGEGATWKEKIDLIPCSVWGQQAEFAMKYFTEGSGIIVEGRLEINTWDSQGKTYTKLNFVAEAVEFPPGGGAKRAVTQASLEPARAAASAPAKSEPVEDSDSVPF